MKRSTWVLAAAVAILLAVILLWERKQPTTPEREEGKNRLCEVATDKVTELARMGAAPLHLKKADKDRWSLVEPLRDDADRYAIEGFVERLAQAKALRFLAPDTPAGSLGLSPPRATWTLREGDRVTSVEVGALAPLDEGLYLRVSGRSALVPRDLESLLLKGADDFRLKTLTTAATQEIKAFDVRGPGSRRLAGRREAGGWRLTAPFDDWGAEEKVERILDDLSLCPVDSFPEIPPDAAAGLRPPQRTIRLDRNDGAPVEIALGGAAGGDAAKALLYASVSGRPGVFVISGNSIKSLEGDAEGMRSLKVFQHDPYEATELVLKGVKSLSLRRDKDGVWTAQGAKTAGLADPGGVPAALAALSGERAVPWQGAGTPGFTSPEVTATLKGEGFAETLDVGTATPQGRFAHPAGRPVALLLPKEGWEAVERALGTAAAVPALQSKGEKAP